MTIAPTDRGLLRELFLGHQEILRAELCRDRTSIRHPTLKGDACEDHWREMLSKHLPRRYRVCRGIIVDNRGAHSDAIDIIIHDAHFCPLFLDQNGMCFVPAESVYAVIEVKQTLTAPLLRYAGNKAASVRRLQRTSAPIIERGEERVPRCLTPILAGIVGLEAEWADGLGLAFEGVMAEMDSDEQLDLGCALEDGAFEVNSGDVPGKLVRYPADTALIAFFIRLVSRLQRIGTVPAIEWARYTTAFAGPDTQPSYEG